MVRMGIAAAITTIGAIGALASGCSSDDNSTTTPPGSDAGNGDDTGTPIQGDSGPGTDAGPKGDSSAPPVLADAKLIVVHAAPGLGPVRLCFSTQTTATGTASVTGINALPDTASSAPAYLAPPAWGAYYDGGTATVAQGTPGIYPGTIGAFPDITSLENIIITPFLIDANLIANQTSKGLADGGKELTCPQLIGKTGLGTGDQGVVGILDPSQFIKLPSVPAQTLKDGSTYLLSLTGCSGSYQVPAQLSAIGVTAAEICGPDFADAGAAGNVSVGIAQVDTTTAPADGGIGIQFAYRSTAIENAPIIAAPTGTPVTIHAPASAGIEPGIVTETPTLVQVDGGFDDAGNPIDAGTTPGAPAANFEPLGLPVKTSNSQITTLGTVPANPYQYALGAITLPGSNPEDGGVVFAPWPFSDVGTTPVPGDLIAVPLTAIAQLSSWATSVQPDSGAPAGFVGNTSYTFVLVGNPYEQALGLADGGVNPAYNGLGVHAVAFPNVFTPVSE